MDLETYNNHSKIIPYCIGFILNNKSYVYYSSNMEDVFTYFFNTIFQCETKKIIFFVHNLTFDGCILLEWISQKKNVRYNTIIKNNSLYFLQIFWHDYEVSFKCSYKILPMALGKIAESFGFSEQKLAYPYSAITKEVVENGNYIFSSHDFKTFEEYNLYSIKSLNKNFIEYTKEYCLTDVKITKKFLEIINNLCIKEKLDLIQDNIYSAPGLSLKVFLKNYNNLNLKLGYDKLFDAYIRPAYYGGRCEVFGNPTKGKHIYHFDYSGMYGWCLEQKFPMGKYVFKNKNLDVNIPGYYHIEYTSLNTEFPILPHHNFANGKLMFANGRNQGIFWFEEIQLFIENGGVIHSVNSGIIFEQYEYCFKNFVEHFNKLKNKLLIPYMEN
jgi:hypothetical protein